LFRVFLLPYEVTKLIKKNISASRVVCFQAENCDLEQAISLLEKYKFNVQQEGKILSVSRNNDLEIVLIKEDFVREEAMGFSEGTKYEEEMSKCDARFEIIIKDFDKAIDEINTLMEVQRALQDASKGYLFTPWNGNITEPWQGL